MKIEKNKVVTLNYTVAELEGALIEQSTTDTPLVYLHGHDNLIKGLEEKLEGALIGDKLNVVVKPEDAYGDYDETLLKDISKDILFDNGIEIKEDALYTVETEEGIVPFYVRKIIGDVLTIDGNHSLAGKTLVFDVEVLDIRDATAQEIENGLPL